MQRVATTVVFVALVVIVIPTILIALDIPLWVLGAVLLATLVLLASSHLIDLLVGATTPDDESGAR